MQDVELSDVQVHNLRLHHFLLPDCMFRTFCDRKDFRFRDTRDSGFRDSRGSRFRDSRGRFGDSRDSQSTVGISGLGILAMVKRL